jgi:hypothetical protein
MWIGVEHILHNKEFEVYSVFWDVNKQRLKEKEVFRVVFARHRWEGDCSE